jgi:hypothetical protein
MPVTYGNDAHGSFIAGITFSHPPTREEAAAVIAFGAERQVALLKHAVKQGHERMRVAARRSVDVRRQNKARSDQALRNAVEAYRAKHPGCGVREIAVKLAPTFGGTFTDRRSPRQVIDALRQRIRRLGTPINGT